MLTKTQVAVVNIPSGVKPLSVDVGVQCEQLSLIDAGVQCQPAQLPDYVLSLKLNLLSTHHSTHLMRNPMIRKALEFFVYSC